MYVDGYVGDSEEIAGGVFENRQLPRFRLLTAHPPATASTVYLDDHRCGRVQEGAATSLPVHVWRLSDK